MVLVSGDAEEAEFEKSLNSTTWAAVPFCNEELRSSLPTVANVDNIPTLVVIRCCDGQIVNEDAVSSIASDPDCVGFPWKPKTFQEVMANANLVRLDFSKNKNKLDPFDSKKREKNGDDGSEHDSEQQQNDEEDHSLPVKPLESISYSDFVKKTKYIALVFSSSWCKPCEGFLELLFSVSKKVKERAPSFLDVFLVPGDREKPSYDEYLNRCPFFTLPFNDPRISLLNQMFGVSSIPTLVTMNAQTGELINSSAREDVACDPDGTDCPWFPKPAPLLSPFEPTNACVEIFVNNPCVLLNLFEVNDLSTASVILAQFREAAAEFREEFPDFPVRFLVTKNKVEMAHTDYRTCLRGHVLVRAEQPMNGHCDICREPIHDDTSEKESDTVNTNHFRCKICGYDVCSACWESKKAGQPNDAAFWEALTTDLGMSPEQLPRQPGRSYVAKFSLREGKSRIMNPMTSSDKQLLQAFFAYEL